MKKLGLVSRNLGFLMLSLSAIANAMPGVPNIPFSIYGNDDRMDLHQLAGDAVMRQLADSNVSLFRKDKVTLVAGAGEFTLTTEPFKSITTSEIKINVAPSHEGSDDDLSNPNVFINLLIGSGRLAVPLFEIITVTKPVCTNEPFYGQPQGSFCSGFLVGEDVVMTAGHCVKTEEDCGNIKFVFGFSLNEKDATIDKVSDKEVYSCGKLLAREQSDAAGDFALVKLDRKVPNHSPVKLNLSKDKVAAKTSLVVIGNPWGLPTKVAGGAEVKTIKTEGEGVSPGDKAYVANLEPKFFFANLDSFSGNSGSMVLNANTGLVEGILVRGQADFELDEKLQCRKTVKYSDDSSRRWEVATRISTVVEKMKTIPELAKLVIGL